MSREDLSDMDPQESRGKRFFLLSATLLIIIFALGLYYWILASPTSDTANEYTVDRTPNSVLVATNEAFNEANALFAAGFFTEAIVRYKDALLSADDLIQEAQILYKIALSTEKVGDSTQAVRLFQDIAANEAYYALVRAYAVQEIGLMYYLNGDKTIRDVTFGAEPYASWYSSGDVALAYRKLFEYASSIYPLGLAETFVAQWYAKELYRDFKKEIVLSESEEDEYGARINEALVRIEKDIERTSDDPNANGLIPEMLKRRASVLGKLAIRGDVPMSEADAAYRGALNVFATKGKGSAEGFMRYFYAVYLTELGGDRLNEISDIVSPLYSDTEYASTPLSAFFSSERSNALGDKVHLQKIATADPGFKQYLLSLGWNGADFKVR